MRHWGRSFVAAILLAATPALVLKGSVGAAGADGPALLQADALDSARVDLAWTPVSGATQYSVYRDGVAISSANSLRGADTAIAAGSTHNYWVTATVAGAETSAGPTRSVAVPAVADSQTPSRVTNLKTSSIGAKSVSLSWAKSTDDVKVIAYLITVGGVRYAYSEGSGSVDVTSLKADTTYAFDVSALDASGKQSTPTRQVVTTAHLGGSDTTNPTTSTLTATAYSDSAIDLSWGASTDANLAGYVVYQGSQLLIDMPANSSVQTRVFTASGLSAGTSYTFTARGYDAAGNLSPASTKTATTLAAGTVRIARGPYVQRVDAISARVVWRTNVPTASNVSYSDGATTQTVQDPAARTDHSVLIGPLPSHAPISYTLNYPAPVSGSFTTCGTSADSLRVAAVGDFGGGGAAEKNVATRITAAHPDFILGLGDDVYPAGEDKDFPARFLTPYATTLRGSAFWTSLGNHEYYDPGAAGSHAAFSFPGNETYYSFDCSGVHVAVIDSEIPFGPGSPQYQWVAADLAASAQPWKIAVFHRPPYSSSVSPTVGDRGVMSPLFEQYGVKLVLSGHSHNYERTNPINGVTYMVSGGGGNGLNGFNGSAPSWSAYRAAEFQYVRLDITPSQLTGTEIRENGTTGDTFTIAGPTGTAPDTLIDSGPPAQTNATSATFAFHATQPGATFECALDGGAAAACTNPTTYTGLAEGSHGFSVQATTGSGGTDQTPATASWTVDTTAPSAPSDLTASAPTSAAVNLAWTAASDANGIAAYDITRDGAPLTSVSGSATSYADTSVALGTTYQYQVVARDPAGNPSVPSNTATVTTPSTAPPVFANGFESGNLSAWTSSGGLTVQSALVHLGSFAAQANTTVGNTYAKKTLPSTYTDGYSRLWFNPISASSQVNLLRHRTAADSSIAYVYLTSTGKLGLRNDVTVTNTVSATTVPFGSGWHGLELHTVINGASSTTEVWLDNVKINDLSITTNLGTTAVGRMQVGEVQAGRTYNVVFDDAAFGTERVGP